MNIQKDENTFYIGERDDKKAELHFEEKGDRLIVDHTFVSDELRGQGVAGKLVEKVVQFARTEGKKILPTCSYAKEKIKKTKEYHDVLEY